MRLRDGLLCLVCCSPPSGSLEIDTDVAKTPAETPLASQEPSDVSTPSTADESDQEAALGDCSVRLQRFAPTPLDIKDPRIVVRYDACVVLAETPALWGAELMISWENDAGEALCGEIYRGILISNDPMTGTHVGGRFLWELRDARACEYIDLPPLDSDPLDHWSIDLRGRVIWVADLPTFPYVVWAPDDRAITVMADGLNIRATDW